MPVFRDRVKDTTTVTGTGAATLSGTAPTGFQTFANAFPLNTPFLYCIADQAGPNWETGCGYLSGSTTLVRDSVFDSSAGPGALVSFGAGTKDIFCTVAAHFIEDIDTGAIDARIRGLAMP